MIIEKLKNILEMKQLIAGYMGKAKDFKIENIIVKGGIKQ